jgi:DNA-binding MarR family transcriptional regulator
MDDRSAATGGAVPADPQAAPAAMTRWTGLLLHWAHARAGEAYAAAMAPLGLKPPQVGVLQWLGAHGPTPQAHLGKRLYIDKVTMVGLLNGLEGQGLVERRPHATDRRAFEVHLTAAGRRRLTQAERATAEVETAFFAALSAEERATLRRLLGRLAEEPTTKSDARAAE